MFNASLLIVQDRWWNDETSLPGGVYRSSARRAPIHAKRTRIFKDTRAGHESFMRNTGSGKHVIGSDVAMHSTQHWGVFERILDDQNIMYELYIDDSFSGHTTIIIWCTAGFWLCVVSFGWRR